MTWFSRLRAIWDRFWPGLILAIVLYGGYRAYWVYQEHLGMQNILLYNLQQGRLLMPQPQAPSQAPVVELPAPEPAAPPEKPPGGPQ